MDRHWTVKRDLSKLSTSLIFGVDLNVCRSIFFLYCRLQVARIYFAEAFFKTSHSVSQRTSRLLLVAILPPSRGRVRIKILRELCIDGQ